MVLAGLLAGCSGPSIEGTWVCKPAEELPVPATITTTFTKPDKAKTVIKAEMEAPMFGSVKLEADANWTYRLEGDKLSATGTTVEVKSGDGKKLPDMIANQVESTVKASVETGSNGTIKWEGNDKFTITLENGKVATFERVKG